jgi:hypothetical protein
VDTLVPTRGRYSLTTPHLKNPAYTKNGWQLGTAFPTIPAPINYPQCLTLLLALCCFVQMHGYTPLPCVDLGSLVSLPALKTKCGEGVGLAVCPTLGLLVTSRLDNTLRVFALPSGCPSASDVAPIGDRRGTGAGAGAGLARVCILGGAFSRAPMRFKFQELSGWMAFTGPPTARLLLVTDTGHDAVHVIDVAGRVHAGFVAAPGTIAGPRGVAARGSLVAVSAWKKGNSGDHVVRVFEGSGAMWTAVCVVAGGFGGPGSVDGQLYRPYGLRFTGNGTGLAVAEWWNDRVSLFRIEDGSFVRHVATGLAAPLDVEECEGGWLVACGYPSHSIQFVSGSGDGGGDVGGVRLGKVGCGDGEFCWPSALALVPGQGLVVRDEASGGRLQFFATPDTIAMASVMSAWRVAWMVAVARGATHRAFIAARHRQQAGPTGKRRRQGQRGSGV